MSDTCPFPILPLWGGRYLLRDIGGYLLLRAILDRLAVDTCRNWWKLLAPLDNFHLMGGNWDILDKMSLQNTKYLIFCIY